ncbi:hypothetical protein [Paenibacillus sp. MDMC362]|uniref:hypothetical protein n=1 Tax=Paenibacillus sp. MDMC362 TaxID=2977365 RepID=UPI000DC4294B|nr:hypothetical protein [Paenibacillus sp. MDMC362]RAR39639.1 hypothetical protein DP091_29580 [Paenibacillus sp. MDMC362]
MRDVFSQRDKLRRDTRMKLNRLYRALIQAETENNQATKAVLDQKIKSLRYRLKQIDPGEEIQLCDTDARNEQRSRLGNVI